MGDPPSENHRSGSPDGKHFSDQHQRSTLALSFALAGSRAVPSVLPASTMSERDVEKNVPTTQFIETLRRLADALEAGEAFRIQVAGKRFVVPASAELVIEHEVEGGAEELSLELKW